MRITLLITILSLVGCGHNVLRRHETAQKSDSLAGESLQRVPSGHLAQMTESDEKTLAALALCHQGKTSAGKEELLETFASKKKTPQYWSALGTCHLIEKSFKKAEFYFRMAKQESRGIQLAQVENNLGILYLNLNEYKLAEEMFKAASKHGGKLNAPLFNLGNLYLGHNMLDQAFPLFKRLYQNNQNDPEILGALGNIYLIKGNYKHAISYFEKMGDGIKERPVYVQHYALALYHQGQKQKAAAVLGEAPATAESRFEKIGESIMADLGQ